MRELPGVNVLHKSNNEVNSKVAKAINLAKRMINVREYVNAINKSNTLNKNGG